eukprot:SAG31_NODE_20664_length_568_cov_1.095949_1_plen_176_part_01
MQTGWPETEVPFYGWCGHLDGIWSGGTGAPQGRDDPEFNLDKWHSEPAVNGHSKTYGDGLNLQLFSALVGVSLSEQQLDGAGQVGVLKGAHKPMQDFFVAQREAGGPLGPGGPYWPREDFNAPNGHGVRHYPDFVRQQFAHGAEYSADGQMWPRPTFIKIDPGDAVLILGHTPHAA